MPNQWIVVFRAICKHARHAALLQSIADTLEWDERTGMPIAAGDYRAEQVSTLRAMTHEHLTKPCYGEWLESASQAIGDQDPHSHEATTVRELLRDWKRNCRLPVDLVKRMSEATVKGQQIWDVARKADSFASFQPQLTEIVSLKREIGSLLADGGDAYGALVDEYEPGVSVKSLSEVFAELRGPLVHLVAKLQCSNKQPKVSLLQRQFPIDGQRKLSHYVAEAIGFDFTRGRLSETSHPFCTRLGPDDCRILSRYDGHWLPAGLYGTMHEAGHGMYEQGLPRDWYGLPPGSYTSLGIHESQSRLWENQVGRSKAFWTWLFPKAKEIFPAALSDCTVEDVHFAVNAVRPSLIRVEADEATYNLHVIIRFELERALIGGELVVGDLPGAWNDAYRDCLGIVSPTAADGVLQDVHWSAGLFGYFPTYTLGNLAAAQLFATAKQQIGTLDEQMSSGNFGELLAWLAANVHRFGRCLTGEEIVQKATQKPLSASPLLRSLETRYEQLFG